MAHPSTKWIWLADYCGKINTYAVFRRGLHSTTKNGKWLIRISACGNYALNVNGKPIAFGQYTDWPDEKTYTETDISDAIREGANEIEIEAWFSSNRFSSHYDGEPGLWAEITLDGKTVDATSKDWTSSPDRRYAFGPRTILFVSHNYTFEFDANRQPGPFSTSVELEGRPTPVPRPIPPPPDLGFTQGMPISTGDDFIVYDLGEERTGLLEFELESMGGERIEIVHGEYLTNGRLRDFTVTDTPNNPRSVVDTYLCKPGSQTFTYRLRRFGCRYLEFRSPSIHSLAIRRVGLRCVEHPDFKETQFRCSDGLFESMHSISCRTLRCCHHEKFENCPWREQSICEYDARNQMLFNYTTWGHYDKAAAMIRLFAKSETPSGYLTAIAPSASNTVIPMFTFVWMTSIAEYSLYSGDETLFAELAPQIIRMLGKILSYRDGNLYTIPEVGGYWMWNYFEPETLEYCDAKTTSFYNLYLREALLALEPLFRSHGYPEEAESYGRAAADIAAFAPNLFWDESAGAYGISRQTDGDIGEILGHVQALFLSQDLVPEAKVRRVIDSIRSGRAKPVAISSLVYLVKAFLGKGTADDLEWLHAYIKRVYSKQIDSGATTWWETANGTGYAGGSGSLCHGWSAMPLWYEVSVILGVRPTSPGFATYTVEPHPLGGITSSSGTVMTPRGPISVSWQLKDGKIHFETASR